MSSRSQAPTGAINSLERASCRSDWTILSLATSILSEDVQRRNDAKAQADQIAAEVKRTNDIIIAGQPLDRRPQWWEPTSMSHERL